MTAQGPAPTTVPDPDPAPPSAPAVPAIALPRPGPGPVPWPDPAPSIPSALGLGLGLGLVVAALLGAGLALRRRAARRGEAGPRADPDEGPDEGSPARRLRLAVLAVRAALVSAFGPPWNARTTEEVARDPALPTRFGPELAAGVVAFLQRVDRVRFGGEVCEDVDDLIETSRPLVARLREPGPPGASPSATSPAPGRSGGRRPRRTRSRRSGA